MAALFTQCLDNDVFQTTPALELYAENVFPDTLMDFELSYDLKDDFLWAGLDYEDVESMLLDQAAASLATSTVVLAKNSYSEQSPIAPALVALSSIDPFFPSLLQSFNNGCSQFVADFVPGPQIRAPSEEDSSKFLAAINRRFIWPKKPTEQITNQGQHICAHSIPTPLRTHHYAKPSPPPSLPHSLSLSTLAVSLSPSSESPTSGLCRPENAHSIAAATPTASTAHTTVAALSSSSTIKPAHKQRQRKRKVVSAAEHAANRNAFLDRNRVAASKCRAKRKECEQQLEGELQVARARNIELKVVVEGLRDQIAVFRGLLEECAERQCRVMGLDLEKPKIEEVWWWAFY